ncbi:hypothetical protein ACFFX0_09565 [Citricoccus parietis]|uniref:Uncharacterized protein n=1 Tax=Citricoccus parietis TaxID=592307 RepID=A0ABV5FXL5_9MICC
MVRPSGPGTTRPTSCRCPRKATLRWMWDWPPSRSPSPPSPRSCGMRPRRAAIRRGSSC